MVTSHSKAGNLLLLITYQWHHWDVSEIFNRWIVSVSQKIEKGAIAVKSDSAPSTYLIFENLFIESAAQNHAVDFFKV